MPTKAKVKAKLDEMEAVANEWAEAFQEKADSSKNETTQAQYGAYADRAHALADAVAELQEELTNERGDYKY